MAEHSLELARKKMFELVLESRNTSGMEFINRLLERPDAGDLVASLDAPELYSIMGIVGRSDSYELIRYATDEQWQGIVDLDVWSHGRFVPQRLEQLLGIASTAGEGTMSRLLETLEDNHVGLYVLRQARVVARTGEPEQMDEIASFANVVITPDQMFFLILNDSGQYAPLNSFVQAFYISDRERIVSILKSLTSEDPDVLEDDERNFRTGRLASFGFPTMEEAERLFSYTNPVAVLKALKESKSRLADLPPSPPSLLPVLSDFGGQQPKFMKLAIEELRKTQPNALDRVLQGFVYLSNIVIVWDTRDDMAMADQVGESLKTALSLAALGLEYLAEGDVATAGLLLRKVKAKTLFRVGHSLTLLLRSQARRLRSQSGEEHGLFLYDPPLDDAIRSASMELPHYFEGLSSAEAVTCRVFSSMREYKAVRSVLNQASGVSDYVLRSLKPDYKKVAASIDKDTRPFVTHTTLVATSLVNGLLGNSDLLAPVPTSSLVKVLDVLLVPDGPDKRRLNPGFMKAVAAFYAKEKDQAARAVIDLAIRKLEDTLCPLRPGASPDTKILAGSLLVTPL